MIVRYANILNNDYLDKYKYLWNIEYAGLTCFFKC